jgi:hypothetical protein
MKDRIWWLVIAGMFCGSMVGGADARQLGIKLGGGAMLSNSRMGGHASIEIPLSDEYPTNIAPFIEVYNKSGTKVIPLGLALLYKAQMTEAGGTIYFGAGGGLLMVRGQPGPLFVTGTEGMITAALGIGINVTERMGGFAQVRWFRSFANQAGENEFSILAGLQINLGGE